MIKIKSKNITSKSNANVIILYLLLLFCLISNSISADLLVVRGVNFKIGSGLNVIVGGNVDIGTSSTITQVGSSTLSVRQDFVCNGLYSAGSGTVNIYGNSVSNFSGTSLTFNYFELNKTTSGVLVNLLSNVYFIGSLQLNSGIFSLDNTNALQVDILGNLNITNNSSLIVSSTGSKTHTIKLAGNLTNNGSLDLNNSGGLGILNLNGNTSSSFLGTSILNDLYLVILNKSSSSNTVSFNTAFTAVSSFLTINGGIADFTGTYNLNNTLLTSSAGQITIPSIGGISISNPNINVIGQNANLVVGGLFNLSSGTFNVGTAGDNASLFYENNSRINIGGGNLNIRRVLARNTTDNSALINFSLSSGTISLGIDRPNVSIRGAFDIANTGSTYNWTGGSLYINQNCNSFALGDYYVLASSGTVTGGNLYFQPNVNTDPESAFKINTTHKINNLFMVDDNTHRNPKIELTSNSATVSGTMTLVKRGFTSNNLSLSLGGDLINNTSSSLTGFNTGSGIFSFINGNTQYISGTTSTSFTNVSLVKTANDIILQQKIKLDGTFRFINDAIIDIKTYDITFGSNVLFYTNNAIEQSFTKDKCIQQSMGLSGGKVIQEFAPGSYLVDQLLPIGTPGTPTRVYSGLNIKFINTSSVFQANASATVYAVQGEHPGVESVETSLKKYWKVSTSNIVESTEGMSLIFHYDASEVGITSDASYRVLWFYPQYPNSQGYWRVDPGTYGHQVEPNNKQFYSDGLSTINGDWTAGEAGAAIATYYSRANGNYNDPNTWSKISFNGTAATTAPNKKSDIVLINNKTVTLTANSNTFNLLEVQAKGVLKFLDGNYLNGDTLRTLTGSKLDISDINGISQVGTTGNVRTSVRDFSSSGVYIYSGTMTNQSVGSGIPSIVSGFVVNNSSSFTLNLTKVVTVSDSLVINSGSLDLGNYSVDGSSSGRTFTMRGGELVVRSSFPLNYTPPSMTIGKINFKGSSNNVTIPSSGSTPGVAQYYDLEVSGVYSGNVTLSPEGNIVVNNDLTINSLTFSGAPTQRFNTNGSTAIFNKTGGTQNISISPIYPPDSISKLRFYNFTVTNPGIKKLNDNFYCTYVVLNDLTISNSATFNSNTFNVEVQGNWNNSAAGCNFIPNNKTVIFRSPVTLTTKFINSRDVVENPFNNIVIAGTGIIQPTNDVIVKDSLVMENSANFTLSTTTFTLKGSWVNRGAVFTPNLSYLVLSGTSTQTFSKTNSGNESFYNVLVNNPNGVLIASNTFGSTSNDGLLINNDLNLKNGILTSRGKQVTVLGNLIRPSGTPGFIDGTLRKTVVNNTTSSTFEVGYGTNYTPVNLSFVGTGGASGLLQVTSDIISATSATIFDNGSAIAPTNATMDYNKSVFRQWQVTIPTGSSFILGNPQREYSVINNFISGNSPAGDMRNGANYALFETRLYTGSAWIAPGLVSPLVGARTSSSTELKKVTSLGTFIVGEPSKLTFYSIASGSWTTASNWSTQGYGGTPASISPTNGADVYIGDKDASNNPITIILNQNVTFDSPGNLYIDSTGVFLCNDKILSGTGIFTMNQGSTLGIADAGGIRAAGNNSGNIRTTTRNFNGTNNHNRSRFIYSGSTAITQANDGLPATMAYFRMDMPSSTLTMNRANITMHDSIGIQSGWLVAGSNMTLYGNLGVYSGSFNFGTSATTFTFAGAQNQNVQAYSSLSFTNLNINNTTANGKVQFLSSGNATSGKQITIANYLNFQTTNQAYLDLSSSSSTITSFPNYNNGEWFLLLNSSASLSRTGLGHIDGEFRKYIPTGNLSAGTIVFQTGVGVNYRPFLYNLTTSGTGEVAGYVGFQNIGLLHPKVAALSGASYSYQSDKMMNLYWRMTRPSTSSFTKGSAATTILQANYINPLDIPASALLQCFDIVYWKGANDTDWQGLSPSSNIANYGGGSCGERDVNNGIADYTNAGSTSASTQATAIGTGVTLGNTDLALSSNNRFLLADFIVAQQGAALTEYYSIANGIWTDPNSWSTVDYNSGVNATSSYPKRRSDVALIGNSKTITLDANIGNSFPDTQGTTEWLEQRLGTVDVDNGGTGPGYLILKTNVIRASVLKVKDGCTLETWCEDGFPLVSSAGNIMQQYQAASAIAKNYNFNNHNNGNYVYKPWGKITKYSNNGDWRYCQVTAGLGGAANYISNVQVSNGNSFTSAFFTNNTGAKNTSVVGQVTYPDKAISLVAGQTYTFRVTVVGNCKIRTWVDFNFNAAYDVGGVEETAIQTKNNTFADFIYTVPSGVGQAQGTTQLRIKALVSTAGTVDPCTTSANGESEDYTVIITNSSYVPQATSGDGLPNGTSKIASMIVNPFNASTTFTQNQNFNVSSLIDLRNGTYLSGAFTTNLQGDLYNRSANNSYTNSNSFTLNGTGTQNITGTFPSSFSSLILNKASGTVSLAQPISISSLLYFNTDNILSLSNNSLTFGTAASAIGSSTNTFTTNRMILLDGSTSSGTIFKQVSTAISNKLFFFPIGVEGVYNPCSVSLTPSLAPTSTAAMFVRLINAKHPQRLNNTNFLLKKYWQVNTTGITATTNNLLFYYNPVDTGGNVNKYIPGLYNYSTSAWEVNIGTAPIAATSPMTINNTPFVNGDWTAGESPSFFPGRIFYSIATGNWNTQSNWSNVSHAGPAASYYPGEVFDRDTVKIDAGHKITYNVSTASIDNMTIGGSTAGSGTFIFSNSPVYKMLKVNFNLDVWDDGNIWRPAAGGGIDTLKIGVRFSNTTTSVNTVNLYSTNTDFTQLQFISGSNTTKTYTPSASNNFSNWYNVVNSNTFYSTNSSTIQGSGNWGALGSVFLHKNNGLDDTLFINSPSFAAQTVNSANCNFYHRNGIIKHFNPYVLKLTNTSTNLDLLPYCGYSLTSGTLTAGASLTSSVNNTINVEGGYFKIGDAIDEAFMYQSSTACTFSSGTFETAGGFRPYNEAADFNFSLKNNGLLKINTVGSTNSTYNTFDVFKPSSTFNVSSGTINIVKETVGANADYLVSASFGSIDNAFLKLGDGTNTPNGTQFKILGTMPIHSLHLAANNGLAQLKELNFTMKGDLAINSSNTFQLRGSTLNLAGNFTNSGLFDATTGSIITDARMLNLNGSSTQTIFNANSGGITLFNLKLSKTAGMVYLSASGNSDLVINNTLEFASVNNVILDASANNFSRTVTLALGSSGNPAIARNGLGHVRGRLYRYLTSNAASYLYPLGAETVAKYRPLTLTMLGNGNTAGLLGSIDYPFDHPKLDGDTVDITTNILQYWALTPAGFALGSGQKYKLETQFLNPGDIRNSANNTLFEHFLWTPSCPDYPITCPASGTWNRTITDSKTATTMISTNNSKFGDVVIGIPAGKTFYSIKTGNWNDLTSWSLDGYTGITNPSDFPRFGIDIVRIGNSNTISFDALYGSGVSTRSVFVEKFNGNAGTLKMTGSNVYLQGFSFTIEDDCSLEHTNQNGISDLGQASGALRFYSRSFNNSVYVLNSPSQSIIAGYGFPTSVKSIIVDMAGATNQNIFSILDKPITNLIINDKLWVKRGVFFPRLSRPIDYYGNIIVEANGKIDSVTNVSNFEGSSSKTITINNNQPLRLYDLNINGTGDLYQYKGTSNNANQIVSVRNSLNFNSIAKYNTRAGNSKIYIEPTASVLRLNSTAGYVDGVMSRQYVNGASSSSFDIGVNGVYAPAFIELSTGSGTIGKVDAIANIPVTNEPYYGNRLSTTRRVPRYWTLSSGDDGFTLGNRKVSTTFGIPVSNLSSFTYTNAALRRSNTTESYTWTERRDNNLSWDLTSARVGLSGSSSFWNGFGDYYIGEKESRTFYSIASGSWSGNNVWAFDAAGTIPAPAGVYPNSDWQYPSDYETEKRDSVIIQNSNAITLNTQPELAYLNVISGGKLIIANDGNFIRQSSVGISTLNFQSGILENKSGSGIMTDTSLSLFRFNNLTFNPSFDYLFSGSIPQQFGTGFPITIGSATISNTGVGNNGIVSMAATSTFTVLNNIDIESGSLRPSSTMSIFKIGGNIIANSLFDLSIDNIGNPTTPCIVFNGSGTTSQLISGAVGTKFYCVDMDRGAGTGVVINQSSTTVTNNFDFQIGSNANNQIFELGTGGNMFMVNSNPSAITDPGNNTTFRYFRTSVGGGSLNLNIGTSNTYTFPVGSLINGTNEFTPAIYDAGPAGTGGYIGLKTSGGSNPSATYAHLYMSPSAVDYLGRFWTVDKVTTTIPGRMYYNYLNSDIYGNENNYDKIGLWGNPSEGASSSWTLVSGTMSPLTNQYSTPSNYLPSLLLGDWGFANLNSFKRLFFSRQSGNWNDPNSWTLNSNHTGAIFGAGLFPNLVQDSVTIGGGTSGTNNHKITLNLTTAAISGVALGTSTVNTGTLASSSFTLNCGYFKLFNGSSIEVGHSNGITSSNTIGAIVTSGSRTFGTGANYIYNGNTNQSMGDGLPNLVNSLFINNSGTASNNTVNLTNSTSVSKTFTLNAGILDMSSNTISGTGAGSEYWQMANTTIRLGGTNSMKDLFNSYSLYLLNINSTLEFYGNNQYISPLPTGLATGLGNVNVTGAGNKFVNSPLLIRKNLVVQNSANLTIQTGINLQVYGNATSSSNIVNQGLFNVGN